MTTKVIRGTSVPKGELTSYCVGSLRLKEIGVPSSDFDSKDIEFIGKCSICRKQVIIGKVNKTWAIKGREKALERESGARYGGPKFIAHYVIKGKRSECIYRNPNRDRSKPLNLMTSVEIFNSCKGHSFCKHAPKMGLSTRIANAARMEKL